MSKQPEPQRPAATENGPSAAEVLKAGEPAPTGATGGVPDDMAGILGMAKTAAATPPGWRPGARIGRRAYRHRVGAGPPGRRSRR